MLNRRKDATSLIDEEATSEMSDLSDSGSRPMNETLMDLPLDDSDQQNCSLEGKIIMDPNSTFITCKKQLIKCFRFCITNVDRAAGQTSALLCVLLSAVQRCHIG